MDVKLKSCSWQFSRDIFVVARGAFLKSACDRWKVYVKISKIETFTGEKSFAKEK